MIDLEEITPEGSLAPVFLDPTPIPLGDPAPDEDLATARAALRAKGIAKLVALGLTHDEAAEIAGSGT